MAEWGIALSRWSNPFAVGLRPPGRCSRGATPSSARGRSARRPSASARTSTRCRGCTPTSRPRSISGPRAGVSRRDGEGRRGLPDDTEASIFYALSIAAAASPTDKTLRRPAQGRRDSRKAHRQPAGSSRPRALHHPQLRRSAARRSGARRRPALREDRAVGAARAAHAVAHVHAASATGRNRSTPTSRPAPPRSETAPSPKNCTRWTTGPTPTCRRRRTRGARQLLDALPEVAARFDPDAIGSAAPGSAGVFALAAIPARYALERGAWAEAAKLEPQPSKFPVHRSADLLRPRDRRRAHRRRGDRPRLASRRSQNIQRAAHGGKGSLLGRAGGDSAARRVGVARLRRRA